MRNIILEMKYRAIIFDLDGVICSTDQYHFHAWKEVANKENIYFDEKINHRLRGVSRMESLDIILENAIKEYTLEEKEDLANQKNKIYQSLLKQMSPKDLDLDVRKTLISLREKGILLGIGSSSKNAGMILNYLGLNQFFDKVVDGNDIIYTKPNPEVFLKASELLKVQPNECLVVEDSIAGVEAGLSAQMDVAGIGFAKDYYKNTYSLDFLSDLLKLGGIDDTGETL